MAQDPASGNLTKGGTVTLTISKGPKLVEVPSFIGKQADEARKALEELGFEVKVDNILGRLLRHSPGPGSGEHEGPGRLSHVTG